MLSVRWYMRSHARLRRGASRELPSGDEEEGVELHDAVSARLYRVLGESKRVEKDEEGEHVVQDDGPREPRHRGWREHDPDRVHRDVGDEDLGDEVRVHQAEEAEDAHDRQAADERDVERIVQAVGQRALLLRHVRRCHRFSESIRWVSSPVVGDPTRGRGTRASIAGAKWTR